MALAEPRNSREQAQVKCNFEAQTGGRYSTSINYRHFDPGRRVEQCILKAMKLSVNTRENSASAQCSYWPAGLPVPVAAQSHEAHHVRTDKNRVPLSSSTVPFSLYKLLKSFNVRDSRVAQGDPKYAIEEGRHG